MTDQLDGRDLDMAVAEAMGLNPRKMMSRQRGVYVISNRWICDRPHGDGKGGARAVPLYSTDPSTQAEKLAFLRQQKVVAKAGYVISRVEEIRISEIVEDCPEPVRVEAIGLPPPATAYGATIDQALARLVVSVAKAKKEQGK